MALVQWKAGLPLCSQTWSEQDEPNVIMTKVDVGPPKVRRRSTLEMRTVNLSWTMDAKLYELFMEFFETDCLQGVNEFEYRHPITKEINRYRFVQTPKIEMVMGYNRVAAFRVSCVWEMQFNAQAASPVINLVNGGSPIRLDAGSIIVSWQNGAYQSVSTQLNSVIQLNHNVINTLTSQFQFVYPENSSTRLGQSMTLESGGYQFQTPILLPEIGYSFVTVDSFSGNAPVANDGDQYIYPDTDSNGNTITVSAQGVVQWSEVSLPYQDITLRILDSSTGIITGGYVVTAPVALDPELILDEPFNDLVAYTINQPSEISLVDDTYGKAMEVQSSVTVNASRPVNNQGYIHYSEFKFKIVSNTGDAESNFTLFDGVNTIVIGILRGVQIQIAGTSIPYSIADNIWYKVEITYDGVYWYYDLLDAATDNILASNSELNEFAFFNDVVEFDNVNGAGISDVIRYSEIKVAPFNVFSEDFSSLLGYTISNPNRFSVINENYGSSLQMVSGTAVGESGSEILSKTNVEEKEIKSLSIKLKFLTNLAVQISSIYLGKSTFDPVSLQIVALANNYLRFQFYSQFMSPPDVILELSSNPLPNVWYGIVAEYDSATNTWTAKLYNLDTGVLLNTLNTNLATAIVTNRFEIHSNTDVDTLLISDFFINERVN